MLGSAKSERLGLSAVKLFSKNSNLYDHDTSTTQTDRRTDGLTTCLGNTALRVASLHNRVVKSCERILTKFLGVVGLDPWTNEFNFGDDLDHLPDPGVRSPKSAFTGLSKKLPNGF